MFPKLFEPFTLRSLTMRNRIVMPAMGTRMCDERAVTDKLVEYHRVRAAGGVGLSIVEVTAVHAPSSPNCFLSLAEDRFIEGHKRLVDAIHGEGGRAGVQLWQGSIAVAMDPAAQILVPNEMTVHGFTIPGITVEQIHEVIDCYGAAAARCVEAGYDCIEFHCAHNYLPHSFLSAGLNHRDDEWGGSLENRAKFPLACIHAIRENIPADMPLLMRIDAHDDCLENGMTVEDTVEFCKMAREAGVDILDVSRGNIITGANALEVPPIDLAPGFNIANAARIRRETGMPTIGVGRINTPQLAEKILEEDQVDLVVMGRAQLADPDFCNKAREGRTDSIVYCVGCDQGCLDGFADMRNFEHITCLRNPLVGHELDWKVEVAREPERVAVVGGGVAGLMAAETLVARGHEAVVFEAGDHLGGQFVTAGKAPGKAEMERAAGVAGLMAAETLVARGHEAVVFEAGDHLGGQFVTAGKAPGKAEMERAAILMGEQARRSGVEIRLETPFTPETVASERFDRVIIANGASPITLGLAGENVHVAHDVLEGEPVDGGRVVVIGGGLVGLEVADALATHGKRVTVLEMAERAGADLGSARATCVFGKLAKLGVEILPSTAFDGLTEAGVLVKSGDDEREIACDAVVVAVGSRARDNAELEAALDAAGIPHCTVGDAERPRRALDAIREGFLAGLEN